MVWEKVKRYRHIGIVLFGAFWVSGCPSPSANHLLVGSGVAAESAEVALAANSSPEPATMAVDSTRTANIVANAITNAIDVNFDVCADIEAWQRPSEAEQSRQLASDPRYVLAASSDSLKRASSQFSDHAVISFTTYGLSARMEPINLSGVWTVAEDLWDCYSSETTMAINQGASAEAWLLNQRIRDLKWQGDRYVMTVEPADTGLQVIMFDRVDGGSATADQLSQLPLDVVTVAGEPVAVTSGDWH